MSERDDRFHIFLTKAAKSAALSKSAAVAAITIALAGAVNTIVSDKIFAPEDITVSMGVDRFREMSELVKQNAAKSDYLAAKIAKSESAEPLRTSEFNILQKQIAEVALRQERIEKVIMTNPVKALEVPMLRRDIDSNSRNTSDALASMQHSVDRVYDQNKYVMLTIFASIVLLAISTFIKVGKKGD